LAGAALWLFVVAVLILTFWPNLPSTGVGWLAFLAFGPPLYLLAEALGGWLLSERHGRMISRKRFSPLRMLVLLFVLLGGIGIFYWVSSFVPHL
jgi:hypothetical protein